jgi:hypothetical protein
LSLTCLILSYDYLDIDVYVNVRAFYRLAGYNVILGNRPIKASLLVVLRGIPPSVDQVFSGCIHVYDYVREHNVHYRAYFPNASQITTISLAPQDNLDLPDSCVVGYLPVFWQLWMFRLPHLESHNIPIHIGNHKPLNSDSFQEQLIWLAQQKQVRIYGAKWSRRDLEAKPLSYLAANSILSASSLCYGLMYPYQRGKSLSGRMWQAPIHGCFVISEPGTNFLNLPGVIEVSNYCNYPFISKLDSVALAKEARIFWNNHTYHLASSLSLELNLKRLPYEIVSSTVTLLGQHLYFLWVVNIQNRFNRVQHILGTLLNPLRRHWH